MHCERNNSNYDYKLYGQKLKETEMEKNLGVVVNRDIKFKDQVSAAIKKANMTLKIKFQRSKIKFQQQSIKLT